MNALFYDCFSGISGDMNLGAMIDLGVEKEYLIAELEKLNLDGWKLVVEKEQRHGITGTKVTVQQNVKEEKHRHLHDIETIINASTLGDKVKKTALNIFRTIAEAEASVHDMPLEKVHFHEVGAIDSIIDITGAAICYDKLDISEVIVSPPELGGGFVRCAHGLLPVPAPATVEILKDIPVRQGNVDFESTTPTGAAILKTLGTRFDNKPELVINRTGYGIGHKDNTSLPNLLRVYIGEYSTYNDSSHRSVMIECNIDDMNPEMYDNLIARLFDSGAADVFLTNIIMKKSRPGTRITVICQDGDTEKIKQVFFTESTTLGLRIIPFDKITLRREFKEVETKYGRVTIKYAYHNNDLISAKPEIKECEAIARKNNLPLKEVYNSIIGSVYGLKQEN